MCGKEIAGQNTESSKHDTVKFKNSGRVLGIAQKKPLRNVPTPAQLMQFGTRVMAATLPTTKAMLAATHETLTPSNAMTATTTLTSDMYQYMPHAVITIAVLALAMYLSTKCEDPTNPPDKKPTYHVQSNRGITPACGEALHTPTAAFRPPVEKRCTNHVHSNRGITPACGAAMHDPTATSYSPVEKRCTLQPRHLARLWRNATQTKYIPTASLHLPVEKQCTIQP